MQGKIIKGIGGFYYVHTEEGVFECRAKGLFRKDGEKPLVGDDVIIERVMDTEKPMSGSITELLPRRSRLIRPASANVDQALVVFSYRQPDFHANLLDRFLLRMEHLELPCRIAFSKTDLTPDAECEALRGMYAASGYPVQFFSAKTGEGLDWIADALRGRTTVLAGPSGVGKSSLLNALSPQERMETGAVSEKIGRGRHTTRHAELFYLEPDTYLMDTPGFSSLELEDIDPDRLRYHFPEFLPYEGSCRFDGCLHDREPECAVRAAVKAGKIHPSRYESYLLFLNELKQRKRY
ncbi:MAG: ribosome small subunit-dependent GTPase A [Lachnospiraceae bacterium]|nr:ribosome small subunit-dependent GTPase A [Lachnospiraceae bacterium]